jgi:hypothetical protein
MTQRGKWTAIPESIVLSHADQDIDYNVTLRYDDEDNLVELQCVNDISIPVEDVEEFCDQIISYVKTLKEAGVCE